MSKRSAIKRQLREGVLDSPEFIQDAKVRRLPARVGGWSPLSSNDERDQGYLKTLKPKSDGQAELMEAVDHANLVLALGPAGTGKTYLAVAKAVEALEAGKVGRIVLSRPAVEAGESIGFLPGRTLNNAFIVVDEAQNCTYVQLKMLLTRLGWHSTMVVTGDPHQSDLLPGVSGLSDIADRLEAVPEIAVVRLAERDIVRHPLVASMIGVL
jgi:phosphate starvation-inducible PhoH-like protein